MSDHHAARLGFWAATITAILGLVYMLLLVGYFVTQGFVFPPSPFVQLMGEIITFATAPALLVLCDLLLSECYWFCNGHAHHGGRIYRLGGATPRSGGVLYGAVSSWGEVFVVLTRYKASNDIAYSQ
jgi:hypothetical protein